MTVTTVLITVATPGTPVQLTTDNSLQAQILHVQPVPGNTGATWLGRAGMSKAAFTGVIRHFPIGTASVFDIEADVGGTMLQLSNYWFDADVAAERLLVTYWTQ